MSLLKKFSDRSHFVALVFLYKMKLLSFKLNPPRVLTNQNGPSQDPKIVDFTKEKVDFYQL